MFGFAYVSVTCNDLGANNQFDHYIFARVEASRDKNQFPDEIKLPRTRRWLFHSGELSLQSSFNNDINFPVTLPRSLHP